MRSAILLAGLSWLPWLIVGVLLAGGMLWLLRARPQWSRLRRLHHEEVGGVQSLAFVLTLPVFIMILMMIVQVSQLMIGAMVVQYAAFQSARSACVWAPAMVLDSDEWENRIGSLSETTVVDSPSPLERYFDVESVGPKYQKILLAAVLSCLPICPSRDPTVASNPPPSDLHAALQTAYAAIDPASTSNTRIGPRLRNKLQYAIANTYIRITAYHKDDSEPPMQPYAIAGDVWWDIGEFAPNELGWQDPLTVTVQHDFALLPGPGRLLAKQLPHPYDGVDRTAMKIGQQAGNYYYSMRASATLGNEGRKSRHPFIYEAVP